MKHLILILLAFSFNTLPNQEDCKQAGDKAAEIMTKRQAQEDIFKLLPLYKQDQEMVFDAYETPIYNGFKYLSNSIYARNKIVKADERRKYEEENDKYKRAISKFKLKYIKLCLKR